MTTAASSRGRGRPADPGLRERRREEILDAAARLFAQQGYPRTDVQLLADTLGVGKGTIYRYFSSKEELFLAAVDQGMCRLNETVQAGVTHCRDPLDRLSGAIQAYLAFFRDNSHFVELLIQERAEFKDRQQQTYFVHRERNAGPWRDLLSQLIQQGRFRKIPVERIFDVLSDLVYGTMFTNYHSGRHKPLKEQARDLLDIAFLGILSDSERKARKRKAEAP